MDVTVVERESDPMQQVKLRGVQGKGVGVGSLVGDWVGFFEGDTEGLNVGTKVVKEQFFWFPEPEKISVGDLMIDPIQYTQTKLVFSANALEPSIFINISY